MGNQREELAGQIKALLHPILEEQAVELVDLRIGGDSRRFHIEIFVDRPSGGITVGECSAINRMLRNSMEAENLISADYIMEVSSPGMDWPLVTEKDFIRVLTRPVKIILREPIGEKMELGGTVLSVAAGVVVRKDESGEVSISLLQIQKASQLID